jgi:polysaccharide biosynthesis protein PelE
MLPQHPLLAVTTQLSALALLWQGDQSLVVYFGFLTLHAAASGLWALVCWALLPTAMKQPRVQVLALMAVMAFFIPVVGALCLLLATWAARWFPRIEAERLFGAVPLPEFQDAGGDMQERGRRLRENSLGRLISDTRLDPALRSRALNALSALSPRISSRSLRQLLGDPVEDLRLVAYGLLDRAEKRLREQIAKMEKQLADGAEQAAPVHRAIAELHFELVQQNLVQGDLRKYALAESHQHLELAMAEVPDDGGLLQLRARILMEQQEWDRAREDLQNAVQAGLPQQRTAPWLAELAFKECNWPRVSEALQGLGANTQTPRMAAAVRYWTGQGEQTLTGGPKTQWSQLGRRSAPRSGPGSRANAGERRGAEPARATHGLAARANT